jgi:hypothetical protein
MEISCDKVLSGGPGVEQIPRCDCGEGQWVTTSPTPQLYPPHPMSEDTRRSDGLTTWNWSIRAIADADLAMASASASGRSSLWAAGSLTRYSFAHYRSNRRETWSGGFPACPRLLTLAASGGATLHISASAAARMGCSAFTSAAGSGMCASLGNASASIENLAIGGSVGFKAAESGFEVDGNFGPLLDVFTDSFAGSISAEESWSTTGVGSHSGSASVVALPNRVYCAFTNRPYFTFAAGQVVAGGGSTVDDNGSAAWTSMALVNLSVQ